MHPNTPSFVYLEERQYPESHVPVILERIRNYSELMYTISFPPDTTSFVSLQDRQYLQSRVPIMLERAQQVGRACKDSSSRVHFPHLVFDQVHRVVFCPNYKVRDFWLQVFWEALICFSSSIVSSFTFVLHMFVIYGFFSTCLLFHNCKMTRSWLQVLLGIDLLLSSLYQSFTIVFFFSGTIKQQLMIWTPWNDCYLISSCHWLLLFFSYSFVFFSFTFLSAFSSASATVNYYRYRGRF